MEVKAADPTNLDRVLQICRAVHSEGGRAFLVGGAVRDAMLGELTATAGEPGGTPGVPGGTPGVAPSGVMDFDLEVFGLSSIRVKEVVERLFKVDAVGENFSVLKLRHYPIDVALPRRERKTGPGHRGFEVVGDPELSFVEAAQRRDFTINAMSWDPLERELVDPLGGETDLKARRLRHSSARFAEDPLRVMRAMQFVARFDLEVVPETVELCRGLNPTELPRERMMGEWRKMILQGESISAGLDFLQDCGWITHFPEVECLIGCPQEPEWHPEGDVWVHTGAVLDAFASARVGVEWEDLVVGFACLCHDFGKPETTVREGGRIRSKGHEEAGVGPTRTFLARLTDQTALAEEVVPLVREHLKPRQLWQGKAGDAAVRRLARRVGRIDRLVRLAQADADGRPPLPQEIDPAGQWLLAKARSLDLESQAPQPLVQGRHLVERGMQPGPEFGPLLEKLFLAQIRGDFSSLGEGLVVLERLIRRREGNSGIR